MDRFEAAARGAYICFRSAVGKLIIVKRFWACYMERRYINAPLYFTFTFWMDEWMNILYLIQYFIVAITVKIVSLHNSSKWNLATTFRVSKEMSVSSREIKQYCKIGKPSNSLITRAGKQRVEVWAPFLLFLVSRLYDKAV